MKKTICLTLLTFLLSVTAVKASTTSPKFIHVFVALCDNENQGIVPVPAYLGNGKDTAKNLYWGAGAGVKTWFKKSKDWKILSTVRPAKGPIIERVIFEHSGGDAYLFAEAYDGSRIKDTVMDFLEAASGGNDRAITDAPGLTVNAGGGADLLVYVGHDGLMDFNLDSYPRHKDGRTRPVIILACKSRQFFSDALKAAGAKPLLLTKGLMAPEAYTLEAAIDGWLSGETGEQVRARAAAAYDKYQDCNLKAAMWLFYSGE